MTPVTTAPTRTPSRGLEKRINKLVNHASFCRGSTALDMVVIPVISTAKPIRMVPTPLRFSLLPMYRRMPIKASTAEGGGLEHIDQEAVALQAGKAQDPAGDRGAHIAAHDNAYG